MYGKSTNGMSEAMNSANRPSRVRGMDMFNAYATLIEMEQKRFLSNQSEASSRANLFCEYARIKHEKLEVRRRNCVLINANNSSAVVTNNATRETFNISFSGTRRGAGSFLGNCSCGGTEVEYFPCEHVLTYAKERNIPLYEITPLEYHTRTWRLQYDRRLSFRGITTHDAKSRPSNEKLRIPPEVPRKPGRPQTRRVPSALERNKRKRQYLCKICRRSGHIGRNCPHRNESEIGNEHDQPEED